MLSGGRRSDRGISFAGPALRFADQPYALALSKCVADQGLLVFHSRITMMRKHGRY
jgi:hypothetical protein